MPISRPIAGALAALATAVAVALPAQAGLAATASFPSDGLLGGRLVSVGPARPSPLPSPQQSSPSSQQARQQEPAPAPMDDRASSAASSSAPSAPASEDDRASSTAAPSAPDGEEEVDPSDDVQVVDGTDAVEDDAGGADGDPGAASRREDRPTGRWARVAGPVGVRVKSLTGAGARVTWRAGAGGVLAQRFSVELRAGRSVLRATTFSSARSAVLWGVVPAKRYSVRVVAVAADGTRRATSGAAFRAPATARPASRAKHAVPAVANAAARSARAAILR